MAIPQRWLCSVLGLVLLASFSIILLIGYILPGMMKIYTLKAETVTLSDIWLVLVPVIGYLLLSSNICAAIKAFNPSTPWLEMVLLQGLIQGLSWGFIGSLILSLVWGIITIQIAGLHGGLLSGLIGLTMLLGLSFISGTIWGLMFSMVGGFRS